MTTRVVRLPPLAAVAAAATAAAVLLGGCATGSTALRHEERVQTAFGTVHVRYSDPDLETTRSVRAAVERAAAALERWGRLDEPVVMHVLPSHEALEQAVQRPGFAWLRAWARHDEVYLQSPRSWSVFSVPQHHVDELVLHELTHCLMYQRASDRTGWSRKGIPLWFREGMASHTARQGYRWPGLEVLARYLDGAPALDPVGSPEALYRTENDIVYGAAHHAFGFLVRRYGEDAVREVLARLEQGERDFPEVFEEVVGLAPGAFTEDFSRYVRLRGFASGRPPPPAGRGGSGGAPAR